MGTPAASERSRTADVVLGLLIVALVAAGTVVLDGRRQPAILFASVEISKWVVAEPTPTPTPAPTSTPAAEPTDEPVVPGADPALAAQAPEPVGPAQAVPPQPVDDARSGVVTLQPDQSRNPRTEGSDGRLIFATSYIPFGTVLGVDIHHPAHRVEAIGFHQSNHEGARDLDVYDTAASPLVLDSRERLSGERSAADVVVDPQDLLRAPVSGTIVRAGTYTLYCDFTDEFLVIEPDGLPGIEVKMLHVVDLQVSRGMRVEGGQTVVATRANVLPFASQVDEWTGQPAWPHTHIEVVDTSIPNQPNGGSGSENCR